MVQVTFTLCPFVQRKSVKVKSKVSEPCPNNVPKSNGIFRFRATPENAPLSRAFRHNFCEKCTGQEDIEQPPRRQVRQEILKLGVLGVLAVKKTKIFVFNIILTITKIEFSDRY